MLVLYNKTIFIVSFMHHFTKNKGDLGVLKVKADLVSKGYTVGSLDTEHSPFDVVTYRNQEFKRIQVKYRSLRKGKLEIRFSSSWADKHGSHVRFVDKSEIDVYAVYCPETDCCYYFNPSDYKKSLTLRVNASLNNQQQNIHNADDFRQVP